MGHVRNYTIEMFCLDILTDLMYYIQWDGTLGMPAEMLLDKMI